MAEAFVQPASIARDVWDRVMTINVQHLTDEELEIQILAYALLIAANPGCSVTEEQVEQLSQLMHRAFERKASGGA